MDYNPEYERSHQVQNALELFVPVEPMEESNTGYMTKQFIGRAVYSDGSPRYVIPPEPDPGETVRIRIRVARGNASAIVLIFNSQRRVMSIVKTDALFDYYECSFIAGDEVIEYYFIIHCDYKIYYYNRLGVNQKYYPEYNLLLIPGFKTPDWAKGAVMYQIFTDRFCDGTTFNNVESNEYFYLDSPVKRIYNWSKTPDQKGTIEFYGGDLQGVWSKLDYLQWLGVEVIYFNPLFVSPSNHKYDTQDYDHIDPHFAVIINDGGKLLDDGDSDNQHAAMYIRRVTDYTNLDASNEYFARFVEEAHKRGMKVILDGVFNHCGSFNKWLDRQLIYDNAPGYEKGAYRDENSPYHSFFKFYSDKWPDNKDYDGWWGHDTLPKLNYEDSPELVEYILNVARKWVSPPYNCDGWRLDVAADLGHSEEFNHEFWRKFRKAVKEANPEALILAENYESSEKWLRGGEWDSIMNYEAFMEPVTWFLTGMEKHSDGFRQDMLNNNDAFFGAMLYHMSRMPHQSLLVAMNELSNHDHSRFLTRTNRRVGRLHTLGPNAAGEGINEAVMREAIVMQVTWSGAPCVYYGDEAGVVGWTDPDNRRTYPWDNENQYLLNFYREMLQLHKSYDALKTGSIKFLHGQYGAIAFGRFDDTDRFVVAINNNDGQCVMDIPVWEIGVNSEEPLIRLVESNDSGYNFCAEIYRPEHGVISVRLESHTAIILKNMPAGLM